MYQLLHLSRFFGARKKKLQSLFENTPVYLIANSSWLEVHIAVVSCMVDLFTEEYEARAMQCAQKTVQLYNYI